MNRRTNLDMDVLRTFATGFELGSFARAAERLGRSQSAISTQIRKLEQQIGQPLVRKAGRGLALTEAGEALLSYAKRILELNDDAVDLIRGSRVEGWVRLGLPQDFAEAWLPDVLGRFARLHPKVKVEVRVERNLGLVAKTASGELDLSLAWGTGSDAPHARHIGDLPVGWIARPGWAGLDAPGAEPLPLIAFDAPCVFRDPSIAALDRAGIAWRVAYTSTSLSGLWAAAAAGLGITMRTRIGLPPSLTMLDAHAVHLPALPAIALSLHRAEAEPTGAVQLLEEILLSVVRDRIADSTAATTHIAEIA